MLCLAGLTPVAKVDRSYRGERGEGGAEFVEGALSFQAREIREFAGSHVAFGQAWV